MRTRVIRSRKVADIFRREYSLTDEIQEMMQRYPSFNEFLLSRVLLPSRAKVALFLQYFDSLSYQIIEERTVKKTTPGNRKMRHRKLVVVGNGDGVIGYGVGKSIESNFALKKAIFAAVNNLQLIERGCGSFQCNCSTPHSFLRRCTGKNGSTVVEVLPAPLGKGLVMNETCSQICKLIGIPDLIINIRNYSNAYNTLRAFFTAIERSLLN